MSSPVDVGQEVLSAQMRIFQHCAKRHGLRVAFGIAAAVSLLFAVISFHAVLWMLFLQICKMGPLYAALCVLGVDLLFVVFFALLAMCSRHPGHVEEQARLLRDQKMQELRNSLALSAVLTLVTGPIGRYAGGRAFGVVRSIFSGRENRRG